MNLITGVEWNLEFSTGTVIQQWREHLKDNYPIDFVTAVCSNVETEVLFSQDREIRDLVGGQKNINILVEFFERTDGSIHVNEVEEAVDLYRSVSLDHLKNVMKAVERDYNQNYGLATQRS